MLRDAKIRRVALMLKAKGAYGRDVITGVSEYVKSAGLVWDLILEEDFRAHPEAIRNWDGDGVIADFDDPALVELLAQTRLPVVGVGGTYRRRADYPDGIPYVATDNAELIHLAYTHLIDMGLQRFALYSLPPTPNHRWAQERELAYIDGLRRDGLEPTIFRGQPTFAPDWNATCSQLVEWLRGLEKPVGVIAVTDSRARQLMQACIRDEIAVPEEVAIIGIDDDPLIGILTPIPISSVAQGTREMGRQAADILHRMFSGRPVSREPVVVASPGVNSRLSSAHQPLENRYVMRALHFIRRFLPQDIKVEQVAEKVGVSRTTLDLQFRKQFGHTAHEEILRQKIALACSLLDSSDLSCEDVARRCGFTTNNYLYAVFRRELGCTPVEYRNRARLHPRPCCPEEGPHMALPV